MSSLVQFSDWLSQTAPSEFIQNTNWVVPATQSVHILALATVFYLMVVFDLRVIGVLGRPKEAGWSRQPMPWMWWGLLALAISGLILVVGEPKRELLSWPFRIKMLLIIVAAGLTVALSRMGAKEPGAGARLIALLTLACWVLIVICGRWIAYINFGDEEGA